MQFFMYGLCSKALPANFSVVPSISDTTKVFQNRLIGIGEVDRVKSADCGACIMIVILLILYSLFIYLEPPEKSMV